MSSIGIIGGYGSVGIVVAENLLGNSDLNVLICGRNGTKAKTCAAKLGERASWDETDIYDSDSLNRLCQKCDIVINCSGPSSKIFDRVAEACLRNSRHYVDPAGDEPLLKHLSDRQDELKSKGLVFVLSAGTSPGLSEVFPLHEGRVFFDSVDSLEFYQGGVDRFTFNSAYDFVCGIRDGLSSSQVYYENGRRMTGNRSPKMNVILPDPAGKADLYPNFPLGLESVVEDLEVQSARGYSIFLSKDVPLTLISIFASRQYETEEEIKKSADMLVEAAEKGLNNINPFFMFHLILEGEKNGIKRKLVSTMTFDGGYRITGIIVAAAAQSVYEGNGAKGCFMLPDSVDLKKIMADLGKYNLVPVREMTDEETGSI